MSVELAHVANPRLVQALLDQDRTEVDAALAGSTLLVPASEPRGGEIVLETRRAGGGSRLVCAFTDLEALQAWDRNPPGAAVALDWTAVAGLAADATVALNPAGPGAYLLNGSTPANASPRPALDLTDPPSRRRLRLQTNQAHELARRTAAAGHLSEACEQLRPALSACAELGDRLHGAAAALELAGWRARSGSTRLALAGWREAAETMAALGELDLALDALLDAAQAAAAGGLAREAEALSVTALDLAAGSDFSDRLITVWRALDRTAEVGSLA
ncbi:MAG TPA: SseB family protein [Solirubrobacteraceae bacterium]|jgi:hypothetical protein